MTKVYSPLFFILLTVQVGAQNISGVINTYTPVTAVNYCSNSVTAGSTAGFAVGGEALLIEMKGAAIDTTDTPSFGTINNYGDAGNYEFVTIATINGNTISFTNRLLNQYDPNSAVQLIQVPQYANATVSGLLTCQAWNGATGGVLVLDISGTLTLSANIDVSGFGFRGGAVSNNINNCHVQDYVLPIANGVAYKGEGIVVYSNVKGGRGALADGGGGGNLENAGGAGGGNYGPGGNGGDGCQGCCGTSAGTGGIGGSALSYTLNKLFLGGGGGGGQQNQSLSSPGASGGGIIVIKGGQISAATAVSISANGATAVSSPGGGSDGEGGAGAAGVIALSVTGISGSTIDISALGGAGGNNNAGADGPGGGGGGGAILLSNPSFQSSIVSNYSGGIAGYNSTTNSYQNATAGQQGAVLTNLILPVSTTPWHGIDTPVVTTSSPYCAGQAIQFNVTGNYIATDTFSWVGPNGFTSGNENPVIANSAPGNSGSYTVVVTDSGCSSPPVITTAVVNPVYNDTASISLCPGSSYVLPNGTIVTTAGIYTSNLLSTAGCDSTIVTVLIQIPNSIVATGTGGICAGQSKQLGASGGLSYNWTPTAGLSNATIANPVATPASTTTYAVASMVTFGNQIVNGDFSQGNFGFTSSYAYKTPPNTTEGQYWVSTAANPWNGGMTSCGDHTSGSGNMLLVNGATAANVSVWCETVNVLPNTTYAFSAWLSTLSASNPAQLQFSIDGVLIGPVFTAPATTCVWQQFYNTWNSGNNTTADICIVNQNTVASGNDFALDDISFAQVCNESDSVTVTVYPNYSDTINASICQGSTYTRPNGNMASTTGTYIDTLATVNGCDSIITTHLTVNPGYAFTLSQTICPNDNFTLPDGTVVSSAGTYVTHLTTVSGCDSMFTTNLSIAASTLAATGDTAFCSGGSALLNATGGLFTYSWSPGSTLSDSTIANPVATPLQTTSYIVASQVASGNLIVNGDFSAGNTGFSSAYNYSSNLYPAGNYYIGTNPTNYQGGFSSCTDHTTGTGNMMIINGASTANTSVWCQTVNVLPNTNYAFSCWGESVSQGNPAQLQFSIDGSTIGPVFTVTLNTCIWTQFYTIWNSGTSTTANICVVNQNTAAGGNDFAIDDISFQGLCNVYDTVTVTVHNPDTLVVGAAVCQGTVYNYPDGTIGTSTGTDTAILINQYGCDSTVITNLTVNPVSQIHVFDTICTGTSVNLPDGTTANQTNTYIVTLATVAGCDSIIFFNLYVTPAPVDSVYDTICQGNTHILPTGASVSAAGIYTDTVITTGGCDSIVVTTLTVNPTSATAQFDTICHGSGFTLPNGTSETATGAYPVTLINVYGCDSIVTTHLTVLGDTISVSETDELCNGDKSGSITATASGGLAPYQYVLSTGGAAVDSNSAGSFANLPAGNYAVTANDNFGCSAIATTIVNQPQPLQVTPAPVDVTCFGAHNGSISLAVQGGILAYNYWLQGEAIPEGEMEGLDTGTYEYRVTDAHLCADSGPITITQPQAVQINISPDSLVYSLGHSIQLNASSNYDPGATYQWSPDIGLSCTQCPNPVVASNSTLAYTVTVTVNINGNNCDKDTTVLITVIPNYDFFIPNVFAPGDNAPNNVFNVFGNLTAVKYFAILIFDRWGEKVYESNDAYFAWDGTYKGRPLAQQVLSYTIQVVFDDNHSEKLFKGTVTLLR